MTRFKPTTFRLNGACPTDCVTLANAWDSNGRRLVERKGSNLCAVPSHPAHHGFQCLKCLKSFCDKERRLTEGLCASLCHYLSLGKVLCLIGCCCCCSEEKKLILDVMDFSFDYFQIFQWKEKEKKETPITSKRSSLNFVSRVESCKGLIFSPRFHPFWAQPGKLRRPYRTYRTLSFASRAWDLYLTQLIL